MKMGIVAFSTPLAELSDNDGEGSEWTEEREALFLERLASLKKFDVDRDEEKAKKWIDEQIAVVRQRLAESSIAEFVNVDYGQVREAFGFAYLAHFGQKRKLSGGPYAEHLSESMQGFIPAKEKALKARQPLSGYKIDFTEEYIELLLHDLLEDFLKGTDLSEDEKKVWFTAMSGYLELRFTKDVSKFVSYVATKFSKRPYSKMPTAEELLGDGVNDPDADNLYKMALSRINLLALLFGITDETHNVGGLISKAVERLNNLETVGGLPGADRKAMETYNLALACFMASLRTLGKDLLDAGFRYLYAGDNENVFAVFKEKMREWQENDRLLFEDVEGDLRSEIAERLGHHDFDVEYRPLTLWRAHEELMRAYKAVIGDEEMGGLNLFTDEILGDERFEDLVHKSYLGRIVIRTPDEADTLEVAKGSLPSFKHLDRQFHFVQKRSEKPTLLAVAGYKAVRVLVANINHPERVLETKITTRDFDEKNEHGSVFYLEHEPGILRERYFDQFLKSFMSYLKDRCDETSPGSFDRVEKALSQPMGSDLTEITDDVRMVIAQIEELNLYESVATRGAQNDQTSAKATT